MVFKSKQLRQFSAKISPTKEKFLERDSESHKRPDILPYLQVSKLACHNITEAGRRHETPGSEIKALLFMAIAEARVLIFTAIP